MKSAQVSMSSKRKCTITTCYQIKLVGILLGSDSPIHEVTNHSAHLHGNHALDTSYQGKVPFATSMHKALTILSVHSYFKRG